MMPDSTTPADRGFTLLELSVVLVIIGLLAGMTVGTLKPMLESARLTQTKNKLDIIEDALFAYRVANVRIPCPTDLTLAESNANFGVEAANAGTCTGGTPTANKSLKNAVEGGVPVATLGLPRDFAYDAWGHKLVYAVDKRYTGSNAFASYGAPNSCGSLIVKDATVTERTTEGMYVLLSHGPNGHGGYNNNGVRLSAASANADEQNNCDCDNAAAATTYDRTYVQRASYLTSTTNQFDDLVRFKLRWHWRAPDEKTLAANAMCFDGIRFDGAIADDYMGIYSVSVGDVNGDSYADLVISAMRSGNNSRANSGSVYVVFGKATGWTTSIDFANSIWWNGSNGVRFDGAQMSDSLGTSVVVGDVNGDGIGDIIMGAYLRNKPPLSGSVYVYFGKESGWSATPYDLSSATHWDGTNGVRFDGVGGNFDQLGYSAAAGDVNGDGIDDIIMSSTKTDYGGTNRGSVYVYFGKTSGWSGTPYDLSSATHWNGTNGVRFDGGTNSNEIGDSVASGDINGDGIKDILMGESQCDPYGRNTAGCIYVYFGKTSGWSGTPYSMSDATHWNGTNGVRFDGAAASSHLGYKIASGDVNGDGIDDVLMGAPFANPSARAQAGSLYVYFGKTSGWSGTPYDLADSTHWNGTNGVRFDGEASPDNIGYSFSSADVNNDGVKDLLIGTFRSNGGLAFTGGTYVYFGKAAGWSGTPYDLADSTHWNGTNGVRFDGCNVNDLAGWSNAAGDVNGDGISDIFIGSLADPLGRTNAGSTYLYFGKPSNWPSTPYSLCDL